MVAKDFRGLVLVFQWRPLRAAHVGPCRPMPGHIYFRTTFSQRALWPHRVPLVGKTVLGKFRFRMSWKRHCNCNSLYIWFSRWKFCWGLVGAIICEPSHVKTCALSILSCDIDWLLVSRIFVGVARERCHFQDGHSIYFLCSIMSLELWRV